MVVAENTAVFHGWSEAGIDGHRARLAARRDPVRRRRSTASRACRARRRDCCCAAASAGPYGLALGREEYTRVIETAEHGGYLLFDHLRKILGGPIVWAPGVDGGVVLSACAAATSCSSPARTSRSATRPTTPTR